MMKKIAKGFRDRKQEKLIKKYEDKISLLESINQDLHNQLQQEQVSIGQWQNKCFQTQLELDAYRKAQSQAMDIFKNHYEREKKGLF